MQTREILMADDGSATSGVLAGSADGKRTAARMIAEIADMGSGVVILNFRGIHAATGSFLREAVVTFRDYCLSRREPVSVVIAEANAEVADELSFLADSLNDVFIVCTEAPAGCWNCVLVGKLDEKQRLAYQAVNLHKDSSATYLAQVVSEVPPARPTAWNNRLAALKSKGLILQTSGGRNKQFQSIVEVINGN